MAYGIEERKAAILSQINGMTHRQLVRFGKTLGLSLGDYMKLSKAELSGKVSFAVIGTGESVTYETLEYHESKLKEAFPQGLFHRGERHGRGRAASTGSEDREMEQAMAYEAKKDAGKVFEYQPDTMAMPQDAAIAALKALLGGNATVNPEQVRAIVRKELEGLVLPVTVNLKSESGETRKLEGIHHRRFPQLVSLVQAGLNVWLAGPAGTGKTTAAHNVAAALGLPFYFNGAIDNEYKLLGFTDAQGRVVSRPFRKAYETGGVYLFDECDASMPSALLAFNAALANGSCDFPDGNIARHKDFRVIAAANTYGHGATADYVGRARMDGAFLDRFVSLPWELDETLERALAGNDKWTTYVQDVRKRVTAKGIKVIVSPRASIHGARMLAAGMSWEEAQEFCIRRGMSDEQWNGVRS